MIAGKKVRRKVSTNSKGNEGETSKDARERKRKELGHTRVELFFSSNVCCSGASLESECYSHYHKVIIEGKS